MRPHLLSVFLLVSAAIPFAVMIACNSSASEGSSEDDLHAHAGALGAGCVIAHNNCQLGLICKTQSSGPPSGAVGLPILPGSSGGSGGMPSGAVGLPLPPSTGGMPSGAVGLP